MQAEKQPPFQEEGIVKVLGMCMNAPQNIRLRAEIVPLNQLRHSLPIDTKIFRQLSPGIAMDRQFAPNYPVDFQENTA